MKYEKVTVYPTGMEEVASSSLNDFLTKYSDGIEEKFLRSALRSLGRGIECGFYPMLLLGSCRITCSEGDNLSEILKILNDEYKLKFDNTEE